MTRNQFLGASTLLFAIFCVLFMGVMWHKTYKKNDNSVENILQIAMEAAYMQGQIDALQGNYKIKEIDDDYKWTRSIWENDERENVFQYWSGYTKTLEALSE